MAYIRARSIVLARVRRDLHEQANTGATTDAKLIGHLQDATDEVWEELTAQVNGPGRVHERRTIAALDPDGYVPGSTLPLPATLLRLVPNTVRQRGHLLTPGRPDRDDIDVPGRYWLDGPTQETVLGLLEPAPTVLLTSSAWAAGDVLEWLYVQRGPLWTDPTDAARDVQADLISPAIEAALSRFAAARAVARGDEQALGRARSELAAALDRFNRRKGDQSPRPSRFRDLQRRGSIRR